MRKLSIVDQETGEIIGDYKPKKKQGRKEKFSQTYLLAFSEWCRITKSESFTLELRLMSVMDSSNLFTLDQPTKQRILSYGIPKERKHLWRGIKYLIKVGFVAPTKNENEYMVSPNLCSSTSATKREVNIAVWNRLLAYHFDNTIRIPAKTKRKQSKPSKPTNNDAHIFTLKEAN